MIMTVLSLAVAGAVISAVVGTFWYSNATPMGRVHMRYLGFDKLSEEEKKQKIEAAKPTMWKMYGTQFALSFLTSLAVAFIVIMSIQNGVTLTTALGFLALDWLCFMVPVVGTGILWSNCDPEIAWPKFFSDTLFNLVVIVIVAVVTSLFA